MNRSNMAFLILVGAVAALSMTNAFAVPPNLWWNHVESSKENQAECVANAESVLREEIANLSAEESGKFTIDEGSVRFKNDSIRAVVECMSLPDRNTVLIITSSNEITLGSKLYEILKKRLQSN